MKKKTILEIACAYILLIALTLLYWLVLPHLRGAPRLAVMFLFYIIVAVIPFLFSKLFGLTATINLGFSKENIAKQLLLALGLLAIQVAFVVGLPHIFDITLGDMIGTGTVSLQEVLFQLPYTILFVGLGEEIFFRGYMLERLKVVTSSPALIILISSLLFGIWHYFASFSLLQVIMTTIIGAFYAFSRMRLKNCTTLSTALAHGCYDAALVLLRYFFV